MNLRISNASFAQRGWSIEQKYLDDMASAFGAGLRLVDYASDTEAARLTINRWVSDQTEKRIPELLVPADVTAATRLYLVNAIYLKAEWVSKFHQEWTENLGFRRLDGSEVSVPTICQEGPLPYASGKGWRATQLDLRGGESSVPLAMTLILPADLATFEADLTAGGLEGIITAVEHEHDRSGEVVEAASEEAGCGSHRYDVNLYLPRLGIETRAGLLGPLGDLGVERAFDPELTDFTGIHVPTANDPIYIRRVIHQANIDVDELGCEAGAATAIDFETGGCTRTQPLKVVTLRLDRPFLFVIRDVAMGAVLFMGVSSTRRSRAELRHTRPAVWPTGLPPHW